MASTLSTVLLSKASVSASIGVFRTSWRSRSAKTVPPDFAMNEAEDFAKMLPMRVPHFRPGADLPGIHYLKTIADVDGLQAVFLWPLVLGLYWSRANGPGALASMASGILCYGGLSQWGIKLAGLHAIVPSLGLGLAA